MNFTDYQRAAVRTASRKEGEEVEPTLFLSYLTLGLTSEAGEVADIVKKHIGHGRVVDRAELVKELGDVLWYLAVLADRAGIGLSEVAYTNVLKLMNRYPHGFTQDASKNREE